MSLCAGLYTTAANLLHNRFSRKSADDARNRLKGAVQHRQRALRDAILRYFPDITDITDPAGGFVTWARLPGNANRNTPRQHAPDVRGGARKGSALRPAIRSDSTARTTTVCGWTREIEAAVERLGELTKIAVTRTPVT